MNINIMLLNHADWLEQQGLIKEAKECRKQADFDGRIDIIPVANPNIFSMSQRVSLAQEQLKLATAKPDIHNVYEAYRRMYNALNVDNVEQILPPPAQPMPMNPVQENGIVQMALVGRQQLQAFPDQNHDAHISAHLNYMTSNVIRANPAMMQILQSHIFQHIGMKAQMMVQQEMQMQQGQAQIDPALLASRVAEVEAELQNAYLQQENEVLGALGKDPLVDLKTQELALRQQEQQQDAQQDQAENMLDRMRIEQQAQLARERIASTEDIANMRAQIALQRTANRGGN